MNITYDYYRIFYFVAKYQSFTKAASILLSNEPNISVQSAIWSMSSVSVSLSAQTAV